MEHFYDEPCEFERQVDEFKDGLRKAVKSEYQEEMKRLRTENAELQLTKAEMTRIKKEHSDAIQSLKAAERDAKGKALRELLEDVKLIMYIPHYNTWKDEKCDKCNRYRRIPFVAPLGNKMEEPCPCDKTHGKFVPKESLRYEFRQRHKGKPLVVWYKVIERNDDHICLSEYGSAGVREFPKDKPYADLDRHKTAFKTEEDCQKYCDWLNQGEK